MNAMSLPQAGVSASALPDASPGARDIGRTKDLYAVWRAVFDRARAVEFVRGEASWLSSSVQAYGRHESRDEHPTFANVSASGRFAIDSRTGASAMLTAAGAGPTWAMPPPNSAKTPAPTVGSIGPERMELARDLAVARTNRRVVPELPVQVPPATGDSVSVFVRSSGIAIVVRDSAIAEPDAVRCAFETAFSLLGQRAALKHLTLNGRTLYQQGDPPICAAHASSLVFAV